MSGTDGFGGDIPCDTTLDFAKSLDNHLIDICLTITRGSWMLDKTLKALSDGTRREILRALRGGDLTAGDIAARFPMTAASVSHHLSVLKDAGLVSVERDGRNQIYSLEATVLQELLQEMVGFFDKEGR